MNFNNLQKTAISFLIILIIFSVVFLTEPKQTEASITVIEVGGNLAANVSAAASVATHVSKETILDTLGWWAAKYLLATMTQSIVEWINSGFEGSPTFVQDPASYFTDLADQASGAFITQLGAEDLFCSPWKLDVLSGLDITYSYSVPTLDRFQCTLGEAAENWDAFMDDFIEGGGWKNWLSVTVEQQNNPFGAYFMAVDEAEKRRAAAQESGKLEASWGSGFISLKQCEGGYSAGDLEDYYCTYIACAGATSPSECRQDCAATSSGLSKTELCQISGGTMKNTTPGKVIADQLGINLGSTARQLELADEIEESLAAIFDALISQLMTTGLSSLTESGSTEEGVDYWYEETPSSDEIADVTEAIDYHLSYEYQYLALKQSSASAYNTTIAKLEQLKDCYQTNGPTCYASTYLTRISEINAQVADYENQRALLQAEADSSSDLIAQANELRAEVENSQTSDELSLLLSEFIYDIQPLMHTYSDITIAESAYDSLVEALSTINSTIDSEYSQCSSCVITP